MVRAVRARYGQLFGTAGGRDDGRAERLADLDRGETAGARRPVYEQDFAGLHARPPDQGAVGRRIDGRKLRRGVVAETVGNSEDVPGIDHRLFGEAAPWQACADPVARIQALDPVRRSSEEHTSELQSLMRDS